MKHYLFLRKLAPSSAGHGGLEKRILEWFKNIDYEKNRITLAATKDVLSERLRKNFLPVKIIELPLNFNENLWIRFKKMFIFFVNIQPDTIVFIQGGFLNFNFADFLAGFISTKGNIYSYEAMGAPMPSKKTSKLHFKILPGIGLWWYKRMFLNTFTGWFCRKILTASDEVKNRLVQWYHYPKNRIFSIYHGINLKQFSPNVYTRKKMREYFDIPDKHIVIISTSRFIKEKCLHDLINAFDVIYNDFKDCWLLLVGDGPLQNELEKLVNKKSSKVHIKFLGYKEDVSDFLKMSDMYVLCSRVEGLGIAVLEALATGLISIRTRSPGVELIKDGVNGLLIDYGTKGICEGLMKALTLSAAQKKIISENAINLIKEKYAIKKRIDEALKLLTLKN